jgi:hypothetical protein
MGRSVPQATQMSLPIIRCSGSLAAPSAKLCAIAQYSNGTFRYRCDWCRCDINENRYACADINECEGHEQEFVCQESLEYPGITSRHATFQLLGTVALLALGFYGFQFRFLTVISLTSFFGILIVITSIRFGCRVNSYHFCVSEGNRLSCCEFFINLAMWFTSVAWDLMALLVFWEHNAFDGRGPIVILRGATTILRRQCIRDSWANQCFLNKGCNQVTSRRSKALAQFHLRVGLCWHPTTPYSPFTFHAREISSFPCTARQRRMVLPRLCFFMCLRPWSVSNS